MKYLKIFLSPLVLFWVFGSFFCHADIDITSDKMSDMSPDEQVFSAQLNDVNATHFSKMTPEQRLQSMHLTSQYGSTGNALVPNEEGDASLSPDKAVEKVQDQIDSRG